MALQNTIESSADIISSLIEKARNKMTMDLYNIGTEVENIDDFIKLLLNMDISGTLRSKLTKATSMYTTAHRNVLEQTIQFADVNASALMSYMELNQNIFNQTIVNTISAHIKNEVTKGLLTGNSISNIVENVANSSISNAQIQTLVNTTLSTYSRTVTNKMMTEAPKNTKYIYIGAIDDKTRDICLQMSAAGSMTLEEIESNFGSSVLSDGGGFNCRHKWEFQSDEEVQFHQPKEAKRRLKDVK